MKRGIQPLYDDYDRGYYWMAKCTNVSITDDHKAGRLIVDLTFDAYPFKKSILKEGHDIWDEIQFDLDIFQPVEFQINGNRDITLYNAGAGGVSPTIIASSSFTIEMGDRTYNISSGETKSELFRLTPGENNMTISGNGTIEFIFYKEVL